MSSPYQLILMNLIHIQAALIGCVRVVALLRRFAPWRAGLLAWQQEQERQLRVLLVLFKQIGGEYGVVHRFMLELAALVGLAGGVLLACAPLFFLRLSFRQANDVLTAGLERASDQLSIADWAGWQSPSFDSTINPPKVLLELAAARKAWPSRWEGRAQFL